MSNPSRGEGSGHVASAAQVKERASSSKDGALPPSYPSATAPTTTLLKVVPASRPSVRDSLRSLVRTEQALTQPVRGVERLAQKQFVLNAHRQRRDRLQEMEEIHHTLDFALGLGEALIQFGADTLDVESALVSVCVAYGLDDVEIEITSQSVIINYVMDLDEAPDHRSGGAVTGEALASGFADDENSYTVMRVVCTWSENFTGLEDTYRLISDITHRRLSRERAARRLERIFRTSKPYSPLILLLANFVTAVALTVALGGTWLSAGIAGTVFAIIYGADRAVARLGLPNFFNMAFGAALITFAGISVERLGEIVEAPGINFMAQYIVAAGLIILLPTSRMVSTIRDALSGYPLTAAGKFVSTGLSLLGIVVGFSSALVALYLFAGDTLMVQDEVFHPAGTGKNYVFMVIASLAIAVMYLARPRMLPWIFGMTSCAIAVHNGVLWLLGAHTERTATVLSAVVVGMLGTWVAYRIQAPALIFMVPSLTFLLPGLSFFRGMFQSMTLGGGVSGASSLLTAATVIFSMGAGVVVGGVVMQHLLQRFVRERELEAVPLTTQVPLVRR